MFCRERKVFIRWEFSVKKSTFYKFAFRCHLFRNYCDQVAHVSGIKIKSGQKILFFNERKKVQSQQSQPFIQVKTTSHSVFFFNFWFPLGHITGPPFFLFLLPQHLTFNTLLRSFRAKYPWAKVTHQFFQARATSWWQNSRFNSLLHVYSPAYWTLNVHLSLLSIRNK